MVMTRIRDVLTDERRHELDDAGQPYCEQCGSLTPLDDDDRTPVDGGWLVVDIYKTLRWEDGFAIGDVDGTGTKGGPLGPDAFCSWGCLAQWATDCSEIR